MVSINGQIDGERVTSCGFEFSPRVFVGGAALDIVLAHDPYRIGPLRVDTVIPDYIGQPGGVHYQVLFAMQHGINTNYMTWEEAVAAATRWLSDCHHRREAQAKEEENKARAMATARQEAIDSLSRFVAWLKEDCVYNPEYSPYLSGAAEGQDSEE